MQIAYQGDGMERRTFLKVSSALALGNALAACGGGDTAPQLAAQPPQFKAVVGWNQTALQAIRNAKPGPPMAARSLAVNCGASRHTAIRLTRRSDSPILSRSVVCMSRQKAHPLICDARILMSS